MTIRLVLEGLRTLLENDCELVGMVEDGRAFVEAAERLRPEATGQKKSPAS